MRIFTISALLLASLFAGQAPAQCPTGITNLRPGASAQGQPNNGTLSWSTTGGSADFFHVYFGPQGSGCQTRMLSTTVAATNFSIDYNDLAPNATYEWRVEAVRNGCSVVTGSCSSFTTGPCSNQKPVLISPPNGAPDDHLEVIFAWDPVLGATGYDVQVQINGATATRVASTGATTTETPVVVIPPGNHSWWVEAKFGDACPPSSSEVWTFGTSCPTGTATLLTPARNAALVSPRNVTFEWTAVSGAAGYDILIARNGEAPSKIGQTREGATLAAASLTTSLSGPGAWQWFVDVIATGCATRRFGPGSFTVTDSCPATPPAAAVPADGASGLAGDLRFSWDGVAGAAEAGLRGYTVWVSVDGRTPAVLGQTTATSLSGKLPAGTHSWFVEATFASCPPLRSSTNSFTVASGASCPTAGPELVAPAEGAAAVSSPVAFSWNAVAAATSYAVYASVNGAAPALVAETTATTTTALLPAGSLTWFVEARSAGCAAARSAVRSFSVGTAVTCPAAGPRLLRPTGGESLIAGPGAVPVTLEWDRVEGATSYSVTIALDGQTTVVNGLTGTVLSNHPALNAPENASYEWSVTAHFGGGCPAVTSERRFFSTRPAPICQIESPVQLSPRGQTFRSQSMTFRWAPVTAALYYRLFLQFNGGPPQLIGTTPQTELEVTLPFGSYTWYVEAGGLAECRESITQARSEFNIERAASCDVRRVALVSPPDGAAGLTNPVQFLWAAVPGASAYQLFVLPAGGRPIAFSEVTEATSATAVLPDGEVSWYVLAFFPGCDAAVSETRRLTTASCSTRPAELLTPFESLRAVTSPVSLSWTAVAGATSYEVFAGAQGEGPIGAVPATGNEDPQLTVTLPPGPVSWFVRAHVEGCGPLDSAPGNLVVAPPTPCGTPVAPITASQLQVSSGQQYSVIWAGVPNANIYEVQESGSPDFTGAITLTVAGTAATFRHSAAIETTRYYRVRARSSCNEEIGPYGNTVLVTVTSSSSGSNEVIAGTGSTQVVVQSIFVPGREGVTLPFTARTDQPWLTVSPSSGELPPSGLTLTVLADPNDLQAGANTATIIFEVHAASKGPVVQSNHLPQSIPVTVSLVSPVVPAGKGGPQPDSLIIPAVAATRGANNSFFQSDVRIANLTAVSRRYGLFFTPSGSNARITGQQTMVGIEPGQTLALNDLLQTWFGSTGVDNLAGVLEIRPVSTGSPQSALVSGRTTIGSSRSFNETPAGTFGQFIPAVEYARFTGKGQRVTLTQITQNDSYRTNIGIVEGSGQPATARFAVFTAAGAPLTTFDIGLQPGEHRQVPLSAYGVTVDGGRIDVTVTSDSGRITAYASRIDNGTNDPLLVSPVDVATLGDTTIVLPGIADLEGNARWRSDLSIYNAGNATVSASLIFHPSDAPQSPKTIALTLAPGETRQVEDVLRTAFNLTGTGGSIHVRTATPTALLASARTYAVTPDGTLGQYIPGTPLSSSSGLGSPALHLLQIEQSQAYRTNLGLAEMSGKPVTVEITAVIPGLKSSPRIVMPLQANEFRQVNAVLQQMGIERAYNARIAVRVIGGEGRITAYAANIDNRTQDPTYIPAER